MGWLTWSCNSHEEVEPSLDYLLTVLKLSKLFHITTGCSYVINTLPTHPEFSAALQLCLTQQFNIFEWVAPAFHTLMAKPLNKLTPVEVEMMGAWAYYILSQTQKKVELNQISVAFYAPQVVSSWNCDNVAACKVEWDKAWWSSSAKPV